MAWSLLAALLTAATGCACAGLSKSCRNNLKAVDMLRFALRKLGPWLRTW